MARFEEERENVRLRISGILGKIEQIDTFSEELEATAEAHQTAMPLGV